jgi:hypothetical protein
MMINRLIWGGKNGMEWNLENVVAENKSNGIYKSPSLFGRDGRTKAADVVEVDNGDGCDRLRSTASGRAGDRLGRDGALEPTGGGRDEEDDEELPIFPRL